MSLFRSKCLQLNQHRVVFYQQKKFFFKYDDTAKRLWFWLQRPKFNLDQRKREAEKKSMDNIKLQQRILYQSLEHQGPDLAIAHFVVRLGGAAKFAGLATWFDSKLGNQSQLPGHRVPNLHLEAADCSNTNLLYESFDFFVHLKHLQYFSVSGCEHIDDWCLDRLGMFRESLLHLDVSRCPKVTERGLTCLHRLRKLRRLEMHGMTSVHQPELLAMMMEEVLPECVVEGVDYTDTDIVEEKRPTPKFLQQYIEVLERKGRPPTSGYINQSVDVSGKNERVS